MKTKHIESAYRNSTTPAARLAAWQNNGTRRNLARIRAELGKSWNAGKTLAELRAERLHYTGPEMSSPDSDTPLLWLAGENDPEILQFWEGRTYLRHRGWFTMDEDCGDTLETCAVRLARYPHLIFYVTRDNGGDALCCHLAEFELIDYSQTRSDYQADDARYYAAREIIRSNDPTTARAAKESRDYYEADQKEQRAEQIKEELQGIRDDARRLIGELRELCPTLGNFPTVAATLRAALRRMMTERNNLIEELNA